jgi:hypothetical protein
MRNNSSLIRLGTVLALILWVGSPSLLATPQFARKYRRDCSYCHLAAPVLNARGEAFLANGYRLLAGLAPVPSHDTAPVAAWSSVDYDRRHNSITDRVFPSRLELISAGPIGRSRAAYFAEWRLLSLQIASGNSLLNRSGRFEDLYVTAPIGRSAFAVTAGQFRTTSQIDVSRRLSISEPQVFSAGLAGRAASTSRATGLRALSPSGRQPGVRVGWRQQLEDRPSDGWSATITVPFPGELTIPFTEGASFEVEGSPKGVVFESYRRSGISSVGGHVFFGDDRRLALAVGAFEIGSRVLVTAAGGLETVGAATESRYGIQGDVFFNGRWSATGRIEDRTGPGRRAAGIVGLNLHVPFGPAWFRQAMRLQLEQRIQAGDHRTLVSFSHVF